MEKIGFELASQKSQKLHVGCTQLKVKWSKSIFLKAKQDPTRLFCELCLTKVVVHPGSGLRLDSKPVMKKWARPTSGDALALPAFGGHPWSMAFTM